ncbi:dihydrofolate reductase family protein [Pseudochryseolinea flava]|uniref:Dihydrofolate reductase n=1 Tax=Pseudochryseolinea flava TaxID=2059302 RepID=A0A364Y152_9BACT|nr:dihydrofolate reductase family protein [Pseudochryseolinea flava]RAW00405.1 dihydrofolate reductase [Pseudochryseolinea flava]
MRNVVLDLAVTLDGFIEGPNGEIDWCIMDDDMDFQGFLSTVDTIFYGRVSYEAWGNYQPDAHESEEARAVWRAVHAKEKVVFSRARFNDRNAITVSDNISGYVNTMKSKAGKDIWLYGGASLIKTFVDKDLIDVYRLSIHPTVLGSGKPLFEKLQQRLNLKLIQTKVFKSGVVQVIYHPLMI